jgi:hypothetical protein
VNLQNSVVEAGYYQRITVDRTVYLNRHSIPLLFMLNSPFWRTWEFYKNQSLYYSYDTIVPETSSYLVDRPYPVNIRKPLYFIRLKLVIKNKLIEINEFGTCNMIIEVWRAVAKLIQLRLGQHAVYIHLEERNYLTRGSP